MDDIKQIALPNVGWGGIIQPVEGLNRTKRQRKGEFVLLAPLCEWGHQSSPALRLGLTPYVCSPRSQAFGLDWSYTWQTGGFLSLQNCESQFLRINLFKIYI